MYIDIVSNRMGMEHERSREKEIDRESTGVRAWNTRHGI